MRRWGSVLLVVVISVIVTPVVWRETLRTFGHGILPGLDTIAFAVMAWTLLGLIWWFGLIENLRQR